MRRLIKQCAAMAFHYLGLFALCDWFNHAIRGENSVRVLMYHRVLPDSLDSIEYTQPGIAISAVTFERQIAFLAKSYNVVALNEFIEHLQMGRKLPRRAVLITFDDGWRDNFECAYPILKKHGVPAVIFVCSNFIGTADKFWFHEIWYLIQHSSLTPSDLSDIIAEADRELNLEMMDRVEFDSGLTGIFLVNEFLERIKIFKHSRTEKIIETMRRKVSADLHKWQGTRYILSWDEINSMDPAIMAFGSHGCSHRLLTKLNTNELRAELIDSRAALENGLAKPIETFAYPNGACDETIVAEAGKAGYKVAFAVGFPPGEFHPFRIGRMGIHEGSTQGVGNSFSRAIFASALSRAKVRIG